MNEQNHILVIRLSALGDVAMTALILKQITEKHPNTKISLLTNSFFSPIFSQINNLEIIPFNKKEINSTLKLIAFSRKLAKQNFDYVFDIHNVIRTKIISLVFNLKNIPIFKIDKNRKEKQKLTSKNKNKKLYQLKSTHQLYIDTFKILFNDLCQEDCFPFDKKPIEKQIFNLSDKSLKVIGIAPFAAHKGKMYPLDLMKQLIDKLLTNFNCSIVLFGSKSEQKQLDDLKINSRVLNFAGKFSFSDELDIISNLDAMIAMDSGNGHLAANFGVKTYTIYGVTHPFLGFHPIHQPLENAFLPDLEEFNLIPTSVYGNKLPNGYENCFKTINQEQIIQKIKHDIF